MKRFRPRGGGTAPSLANINSDTIRRAEEAVGRLSDQYRGWVRGDIEKLRKCLEDASAGGEARIDAYKVIRQIAHDMRGQGTTFGYPLVTRIAQSISHILKNRSADDDNDATLDAHINAVERIIEENVADPTSSAAAAIIGSLELAIGSTLA
jgi:hypothetical protein